MPTPLSPVHVSPPVRPLPYFQVPEHIRELHTQRLLERAADEALGPYSYQMVYSLKRPTMMRVARALQGDPLPGAPGTVLRNGLEPCETSIAVTPPIARSPSQTAHRSPQRPRRARSNFGAARHTPAQLYEDEGEYNEHVDSNFTLNAGLLRESMRVVYGADGHYGSPQSTSPSFDVFTTPQPDNFY